MIKDILLPELGENISGGDIVRVRVAPGDHLSAGDAVVEIETDKAVIEVPAGIAGVVTEVLVAEGSRATVGQLLLRLEAEEGAAAVSAPAAGADTPAIPPAVAKTDAPPEPAPATKAEEPPVPTPAGADAVAAVPPAAAPEATSDSAPVVPVAAPAASPPAGTEPASPDPARPGVPAPAAPSVRREARELGVDIFSVPGSGANGRISVEDVRRFVKERNRQLPGGGSSGQAGSLGSGNVPYHTSLPDQTRFGGQQRTPMSNVRRTTARHMAATWNTVPQVTQFDTSDITDLEVLRRKLAPAVEAAGGKLTMTGILLKVCATALTRHPQFNVSVDMAGETIVAHDYVHIGVAVDTPRGLLVPVLREADRKSITTLCVELTDLSTKARDRKTSPEDLSGGCFTISNLGGIGGTAFSPIVNFPEVAILGVSRATTEPRWDGQAFQPRLVLPLSLSYDHRVIDGADAARFLRWICEALEQPLLLVL